jgi:acyl-CoA synthetase (AMP-forming)/AMP-acid ligase II/thioesterase domain-containing protein
MDEGTSGDMNQTLWNLIEEAGVSGGNRPAIMAPGRYAVSYRQLAETVRDNVHLLRIAGIGARDRVAIVLPNGPEMAVTLLTAMAAGTAAPLNPDYSGQEFNFYLTDLGTRALFIQRGMNSPSREVAASKGIPVLELRPGLSAEASLLRLDFTAAGPPSNDPPAGPNDIALLLHTSGTTSRPKLVPLTQSNLCFSARNIREHLQLSSEDRCLNVMPLFHIHGLVASLLATLISGGSIVCTRGFLANDFFSWLREFQPTWYTAVPTIHQSVVAQAPQVADPPNFPGLRFIRSCSSSLSPSVMSDLEKLFRVPVVEAYGMTEASHQIACNPLPPKCRKPGSVGIPTGVEITILDGAGNSVPTGTEGEVSIRGRTVSGGYLGNPEANATAFSEGWLRTGDIGRFDAEGYLYLSGRSKEMINRGGEKISPREVEDVLLAHPAVAQAAVFSLPDERLGEDVGAALVLKPGAKVAEIELRRFVGERLAFFKVPRRVVFVTEIPKGPTGKPQRIGLAARLGLHAVPPRAEKRRTQVRDGSMEGRVLDLMRRILRQDVFGTDDNFFEAGGDSGQAAALLTEVRMAFGVEIQIASFIIDPTAKYLTGIVEGTIQPASTFLIPIKKTGANPPFFCVHPHDGRVSLFYPLANQFAQSHPFYAFQAISMEELRPIGGGIERVARRYVAEMKTIQPEGPYRIGGYCFGALVAFEMARFLAGQGERVAFLALIDSYSPDGARLLSTGPARAWLYSFVDQARRMRPLLSYISHLPPDQRRDHLLGLLKRQACALRSVISPEPGIRRGYDALPGREDDWEWQYSPGKYPGSAVLFRASRTPLGFEEDIAMGWNRFIEGTLEIERIQGYHRSLIFEPSCRRLAVRLNIHLHRACVGG